MRLIPSGHHGAAMLARGDRIDCGAMTVTAAMIDTFADMTGDRFEIHMSDAAARRHGFGARVAHGLLVMSLIDGLKNGAPAQLRARASLGWHWSFHRPVLAGDRIAVSITIAAIEWHEKTIGPFWCSTSVSPTNTTRMRSPAPVAYWSIADRHQISKSRTKTPSAPPSSSATIRVPMLWCTSSAR